MINIPGKVFILADPNGKAWKFATEIHEDLDNRIPNTFYLNELSSFKHRNKEISLEIEDNVRGGYCFYIADSNQYPQDWFTQNAFALHTLKNSSADLIAAIFPNLFFERQDRKDKARKPISSQVVADIVGLYADRVMTLDVHSLQTQGFYRIPFDSLPSHKTVEEYLKQKHQNILNNNLTLASPDSGGAKRTESFAARLGNPNIAIGYKIRIKKGDDEGEVEKVRFPKEQVENRDIFLIDDIGDSFGTIDEAYDELKDKGAQKVYAYTTKAFFTEGYDILGKLEKVFIGDVITQPYDGEFSIPEELEKKLEVIPFSPLFAEAIYRTSIGHSLSALFK